MKFAPLAAAISASLLVSACVDLGDDNDNDDKGVSYQATATLGTVTNGVGDYTVKVTASDGSDLEGASISVLPIMDMMNNGSIDHATPVSQTEGELDENGEFSATGYFLMQTMDNSSWYLEVSNESEGITQRLPITVNWDGAGRSNLYGADDGAEQDTIIDSSNIETPRDYYVFSKGVMDHGSSKHVTVFVGARETAMKFSPVSVGETLTGSTQDLYIGEVDIELCVTDCSDENNWKSDQEIKNEGNGVYSAMFPVNMVDSISARVTVEGATKKATVNNMEMDYVTISLGSTTAMPEMDHSDMHH